MKKKLIPAFVFAGIMIFVVGCSGKEVQTLEADPVGIAGKIPREAIESYMFTETEETTTLPGPVERVTEEATIASIETPSDLDEQMLYDVSSYLTEQWARDPILDYSITLDGDSYKLPFNAEELIANGWEHDSDWWPDVGVKSGNAAPLMFKRDGKELHVDVLNPYTKECKATNCWVYEIRLTAYDWEDAEDIIPYAATGYNIALGDSVTPTEDMFGDNIEAYNTAYDTDGYFQWWETESDDKLGQTESGISFETTDGVITQLCLTCRAMGSDFTGE